MQTKSMVIEAATREEIEAGALNDRWCVCEGCGKMQLSTEKEPFTISPAPFDECDGLNLYIRCPTCVRSVQ